MHRWQGSDAVGEKRAPKVNRLSRRPDQREGHGPIRARSASIHGTALSGERDPQASWTLVMLVCLGSYGLIWLLEQVPRPAGRPAQRYAFQGPCPHEIGPSHIFSVSPTYCRALWSHKPSSRVVRTLTNLGAKPGATIAAEKAQPATCVFPLRVVLKTPGDALNVGFPGWVPNLRNGLKIRSPAGRRHPCFRGGKISHDCPGGGGMSTQSKKLPR